MKKYKNWYKEANITDDEIINKIDSLQEGDLIELLETISTMNDDLFRKYCSKNVGNIFYKIETIIAELIIKNKVDEKIELIKRYQKEWQVRWGCLRFFDTIYSGTEDNLTKYKLKNDATELNPIVKEGEIKQIEQNEKENNPDKKPHKKENNPDKKPPEDLSFENEIELEEKIKNCVMREEWNSILNIIDRIEKIKNKKNKLEKMYQITSMLEEQYLKLRRFVSVYETYFEIEDLLKWKKTYGENSDDDQGEKMLLLKDLKDLKKHLFSSEVEDDKLSEYEDDEKRSKQKFEPQKLESFEPQKLESLVENLKQLMNKINILIEYCRMINEYLKIYSNDKSQNQESDESKDQEIFYGQILELFDFLLPPEGMENDQNQKDITKFVKDADDEHFIKVYEAYELEAFKPAILQHLKLNEEFQKRAKYLKDIIKYKEIIKQMNPSLGNDIQNNDNDLSYLDRFLEKLEEIGIIEKTKDEFKDAKFKFNIKFDLEDFENKNNIQKLDDIVKYKKFINEIYKIPNEKTPVINDLLASLIDLEELKLGNSDKYGSLVEIGRLFFEANLGMIKQIISFKSDNYSKHKKTYQKIDLHGQPVPISQELDEIKNNLNNLNNLGNLGNQGLPIYYDDIELKNEQPKLKFESPKTKLLRAIYKQASDLLFMDYINKKCNGNTEKLEEYISKEGVSPELAKKIITRWYSCQLIELLKTCSFIYTYNDKVYFQIGKEEEHTASKTSLQNKILQVVKIIHNYKNKIKIKVNDRNDYGMYAASKQNKDGDIKQNLEYLNRRLVDYLAKNSEEEDELEFKERCGIVLIGLYHQDVLLESEDAAALSPVLDYITFRLKYIKKYVNYNKDVNEIKNEDQKFTSAMESSEIKNNPERAKDFCKYANDEIFNDYILTYGSNNSEYGKDLQEMLDERTKALNYHNSSKMDYEDNNNYNFFHGIEVEN